MVARKAPSGRELAPKAPEGAREPVEVLQGRESYTVVALNWVVGIQNKIKLFSRALSPCRSRATPPPGGGLAVAALLGIDFLQRADIEIRPYGY